MHGHMNEKFRRQIISICVCYSNLTIKMWVTEPPKGFHSYISRPAEKERGV